MKKDKHPIIANGELYVESIIKKNGSGPKKLPHEYEEAKHRIYNDLKSLEERISDGSEIFLEEKVLCIRLEPKFEAKSYTPDSLLISDDMSIIGGRKYTYKNDAGEEVRAKLYFIKTKDKGIQKLKSTIESGKKDSVEKWKKQIQSIKNIDLLHIEEKKQGLLSDWVHGNLEVVLHPFEKNTETMIQAFKETIGLTDQQMKVRTYEKGLTFISLECDRSILNKMEKFNPLRTIHQLEDVQLDPFRNNIPEAIGPKPASKKMKSNIKIGLFDGGIREELPLLNGYVKAYDVVKTNPTEKSLNHGTGVCGSILYGNLAGFGSNDELINPIVSVESYRVLPGEVASTKKDLDVVYGMYDTIDIIEKVVSERKDIRLYNLSFGPKGPILDDNISRFTYALDRLTYQVDDDEVNPLFCIAVGNDGDKGDYLDRIQAPADMVNGLSIGAYTYNIFNDKIRAAYSCKGPGREGAKTKPDILEFGGNYDRPFVVVGSKNNMVGVSAGTSLATPIATGKIGKLMAHSRSIHPHLGRTLLIHNAKCDTGLRNDDDGYGYSEDSIENLLKCDDNRVTILYSGELPSANTVKLPIFSPAINHSSGNVRITWTITTIVNPDVTDTDSYTNNCIEDTFYPNSSIFRFSKGKKGVKINISESKDAERIKYLLEQGYKMSSQPVSGSPKKDNNESELRNSDFKWDTVIKKEKFMRAKSLLNPFITLHAIGRNGYERETIKYFVAITIDAPGYKGNLYNSVLQTYNNLIPIKVQNVNRVMVPID